MHAPKHLQKAYHLAKNTIFAFLDNGGPLLSAALAFYSILSIAPLALIAVYVAGLVFGEQAAGAQLRHSLEGYFGPSTATAVTGLMEKLRGHHGGGGASVIGFVLLLFGASRLFSQLQDAINQLWHVRTDFGNLKKGVLTTLYKKLLAFVLVLGLGALLSTVIVASTFAASLKQILGDVLPGSDIMWSVYPIASTTVLVSVAFALIYRLMPDATVSWRDAAYGGFLAGVLFSLAEYPLSYYMAHQGLESAYGAAGSLVVLLLWVYYASHIFFLGAQFTQVFGDAQGRAPEPDAMAVMVKQVVANESDKQ